MINTLNEPIELCTIRKENFFAMTQHESTRTRSPTLTSSAPAFLVNLFQSADEDLDLLIHEAHSFMKSSEWLKPGTLSIFSLKTSRGYSLTKAGRPSVRLSRRFMTWGILLNGVCLTASTSVCHKNESEYTLSAILIPDCPEKYFLSERAMARLLSKSSRAAKGKGSTRQKEQAHV